MNQIVNDNKILVWLDRNHRRGRRSKEQGWRGLTQIVHKDPWKNFKTSLPQLTRRKDVSVKYNQTFKEKRYCETKQNSSLTRLNILPVNCHVFVSVRSTLFVVEPKSMHHFVADYAFLVATNSKGNQLR